MNRYLKFLVAIVIAFTASTQTIACPTCVGRLRLSVKKPFFELYKPKPKKQKSKKTHIHAVSYQKTGTRLPSSPRLRRTSRPFKGAMFDCKNRGVIS